SNIQYSQNTRDIEWLCHQRGSIINKIAVDRRDECACQANFLPTRPRTQQIDQHWLQSAHQNRLYQACSQRMNPEDAINQGYEERVEITPVCSGSIGSSERPPWLAKTKTMAV